MRFSQRAGALTLIAAPLCFAAITFAHGIVGNRFFPATIATDDPFAVDEFSLTGNYQKFPGDGDPSSREIDGGFEFVKEIFPRFAIGVEGTYVDLKPHAQPRIDGWDNLGLSAKFEIWQSDAHEAIVSIGLDADLGGSGSSKIGESFSTFTPAIFFGKGFGDLPPSLGPLRPLAVTGIFGQTFPTGGGEPNSLAWGFAVEYSLPYLQSQVKDIGLREPLKNMIPLIEFAFDTPENRGGGATTGTVNPGVLWESREVQLGVEANIPVNRASGDHVRVTVQMQIYIDDLMPRTFGQPVFGERE